MSGVGKDIHSCPWSFSSLGSLSLGSRCQKMRGGDGSDSQWKSQPGSQYGRVHAHHRGVRGRSVDVSVDWTKTDGTHREIRSLFSPFSVLRSTSYPSSTGPRRTRGIECTVPLVLFICGTLPRSEPSNDFFRHPTGTSRSSPRRETPVLDPSPNGSPLRPHWDGSFLLHAPLRRISQRIPCLGTEVLSVGGYVSRRRLSLTVMWSICFVETGRRH